MASVDLVLNEGVKQKSKVYDLGWKKEDLPREREGYFFLRLLKEKFLDKTIQTHQSVSSEKL